jgi:hypothetical protein
MADNIPTPPTGPPPNSPPPGGGNGTNTGTGPGNNTGNSGNSGNRNGNGGGRDRDGGGGGGYKSKAARKYLQQAETLDEQIEALLDALGVGKGRGAFYRALKQRLENVGLVQRQQDRIVMEGYRDRVKSLRGAKDDNEAALADQDFAAGNNLNRERANAVSEAMMQGAGESDLLRSQAMSLRSWDSNQSEVRRSYSDTMRSINSSLTDLNIDTKTARTNLATEANADREQLWAAYYGQRSEAFTQLGNIYGQQAELYTLAQEMKGSKKTKGKLKHAESMMGEYFDAATTAAGQAWDNPGISRRLRRWDGREEFEQVNNRSRLSQATTNVSLDRPEGATLREWTA